MMNTDTCPCIHTKDIAEWYQKNSLLEKCQMCNLKNLNIGREMGKDIPNQMLKYLLISQVELE